MAKIAIIPPNLPFFFDFSCQTQDYNILFIYDLLLFPSVLIFVHYTHPFHHSVRGQRAPELFFFLYVSIAKYTFQ